MRSFVHVTAIALCFLALAVAPAAGEDARWDLDAAEGFPTTLSLDADHRTRFEYLNDTFRPTGGDAQSVFVLRTRVRVNVQLAPWLLVAGEFQDSRALNEDSTLRVGTGIVNSTELIRAYAEVSGDAPFGGKLKLTGGRLTMTLGDQRLVARTIFRNAANSFTGLDLKWEGNKDKASDARVFWLLPVQRRPSAATRTHDNDYRWDREGTSVQFFGGFGTFDLPGSEAGDRLELFAFGLLERDTAKLATRNRKLATQGFRLFRKPAPGAWDYQLESVVQAGQSRSSTASTRDLDHLAHFHHAEVGYSFSEHVSQPRIALEYDFASGDKDPTDPKNQRFDTLYGARRFDLGPTSIFGAVGRANIHSPAIRAQLKPAANVTSFIAVRPLWRATSGDVWTTASPIGTGSSNKYLGTQVELRVRWNVVPKNVLVEAGYAHLFKGNVAKRGSATNGGSDYLYTQVILSF